MNKQDNKTILSIETSCDETSVAIISNNKVINNIIASSANKQTKFGGVVPEVAAREHEKNIINTLSNSLKDINIKKITHIAYTSTPGLRVCINVGEILAKTLANFLKIELLPINHLYGHIFSFWDLKSSIEYPFISLVASGGNTILYLVNSPNNIEVLNQTTDDAIGECYDKVARVLGLGYPGGPKIDKLFDESKANINFIHNKNFDTHKSFSFSGLKTAVLNYINNNKNKLNNDHIIEIVSSFQKQAIDILIDKTNYYLNLYKVNSISIGGGVAANNYLRNRISSLNIKNKYIPNKNMCGDNALMIGLYALLSLN